MKKILAFILTVLMVSSLTACKMEETVPENEQGVPSVPENSEAENPQREEQPVDDGKRKEVSSDDFENAVEIVLSEKITVNGKTPEESGCVTVGGEIVYYKNMEKYPSGNDYGDGEKKDMHTEEEASEYTLVTITEPGEYFVKGELKGQLAVDLGENAKDDPNAKVTLIFGGADITCGIAPAVIFYNVYDCENAEELSGKSGAEVIVADGSISNINGANVAKIYKDDGNEKKLHKYDAAFYSKMSMNISGGEKGTGVLNITGENEGLGSKMHLSVDGGILNIKSNDDGINANEDGVSVILINGGKITVAGGFGEEGDGIDSNGKLIINGGELYSFGNGRSADGGIDADKGIFINGGKVVALGCKNDSISKDSKQLFAELEFNAEVPGNSTFEFTDSEGNGIKLESERLFRSAVISDENFAEGKEYSLKINGNIQEYGNNRSKSIFENGGFFNPQGQITSPALPENPYKKPEELEDWLENEKNIPGEIREWIEHMSEVSDMFGGMMIPEKGSEQNENPGEPMNGADKTAGGLPMLEENGVDKTVFAITAEKPMFTGITVSEKYSGKKTVSFDINGNKKMEDIYIGDLPEIVSVGCSEDVPPEDIKVILIYTGRDSNISIFRSCFLSEGYEKLNGLFKDLPKGDYRLSLEVAEENEKYMGIEYFSFDVVD